MTMELSLLEFQVFMRWTASPNRRETWLANTTQGWLASLLKPSGGCDDDDDDEINVAWE